MCIASLRLCLCGIALGCVALAGRADDRDQSELTHQSDSKETTQEDAIDEEPIDFDQARKLIQRQRQGQRLSPQEQNYLSRAREARQTQGRRPPARNERNEAKSTGQPFMEFPALTENEGAERYRGQMGGLYGEGRNRSTL